MKILQKLKRCAKKRYVFAALVALILTNCTVMSISLARYVSHLEENRGASVAEFSPTLKYLPSSSGDSWSDEKIFRGLFTGERSSMPFIIDNSTSATPARVTVFIETDKKLPLDIQLYATTEDNLSASTPLVPIPEESVFGYYVYECDIGVEKKNFCITVEWGPDNYDETFAGLESALTVRVVCEQKQ